MLFVGSIVVVLICRGNFVGLVSLSAFTILVYYGLTNLSALRLKKDQRLVPLIVPAVGLVFCLMLATSIPPKLMAPGAGVLAAGILWRLLFRRRSP